MAQHDPLDGDPGAQEHAAAHADRQRAGKRKALSAKGVHIALLLEGREEINRPPSALAWSGLASGIAMGLSLLAEGVLRAHLPDTPWRPLVSKLGYSFGFIAVTLGRQQLFTETTLTAFLPWAHDGTRNTLVRMLRLWLILLITNLVGAYLFAAAVAHTNAFPPEIHVAFWQIAEEASGHDFWTALVKGIFGGWMIAFMVWMLPSAAGAKLWVVILITWLLAAAGLTHIIAGSIEVFYLVTLDVRTFGAYVTGYGLPVLIGNTIGGVVLVAALNHAQVASGQVKP